MQPYPGRLLIEPFESESVLEQVDKKFQCIGTVKAINGESFFKVGDIIAYNIWGIDTVKYKDQEYFFLLEHPDFILGRLDNAVE